MLHEFQKAMFRDAIVFSNHEAGEVLTVQQFVYRLRADLQQRRNLLRSHYLRAIQNQILVHAGFPRFIKSSVCGASAK